MGGKKTSIQAQCDEKLWEANHARTRKGRQLTKAEVEKKRGEARALEKQVASSVRSHHGVAPVVIEKQQGVVQKRRRTMRSIPEEQGVLPGQMRSLEEQQAALEEKMGICVELPEQMRSFAEQQSALQEQMRSLHMEIFVERPEQMRSFAEQQDVLPGQMRSLEEQQAALQEKMGSFAEQQSALQEQMRSIAEEQSVRPEQMRSLESLATEANELRECANRMEDGIQRPFVEVDGVMKELRASMKQDKADVLVELQKLRAEFEGLQDDLVRMIDIQRIEEKWKRREAEDKKRNSGGGPADSDHAATGSR